MNRSDTEHKSVGKAVDSNVANTRLTGSWLAIARTVWLVLVIPSLGFCIASLLVSYQQVQSGPFLHKCYRSSLPSACLSVVLPL
jgi:hypothetical protein